MKISKRDWAQLSAYLDGELSQADSSKLEVRIENNPDFQAALEDLKTVRTVLSHTPRLSVPRDFTLKQSVFEQSPKRLPFRRYRLATAILTILFLGVVVVDFGSGILLSGISAGMPPRAEEVMLEAAADAQEEPEMMVVEGVEEDSLDVEPGTGDTSQPLEMEETPSAVEMEEAPLAAEKDEPAEEGEASGISEPDTKTSGEDAERAVDGAEAGDQGDTQNQITEEEGFELEEEMLPPAEEITRVDDPFRIPWLRVLEIVLGLGALGFGIAAWRKSRTP